ncbi:MAG: GNAT family protein [Limnohabitans sp.]|nr:GNAT family protein [Limnohabitans sp.]
MISSKLSIREQKLEDIEKIVNYFLSAHPDFLLQMGVDVLKFPSRTEWLQLLTDNHNLEIAKKSIYYLIWVLDNETIGHCNINKIIPRQEAYMHLHLWQNKIRQKGLGLEYLKLSIPVFFNKYNLKKLYCEPYLLNPAPNKILEKFGFELITTYETTPGWINFHQPVNKWCLTKEKLIELHTRQTK